MHPGAATPDRHPIKRTAVDNCRKLAKLNLNRTELGSMRITEVRRADVHAWRWSGPPSRSRTKGGKAYELFASAFDDAVVTELIDTTPCTLGGAGFPDEMKFGELRDDVFLAKSGFGGAEYLLSALVSEGSRRGLTDGRVAELTALNPASRFGLRQKGAIEVGRDADFAVVDDAHAWTIRAADSLSQQEYTPFEGFELTAKVTNTILRGEFVYADGQVAGQLRGQYLSRRAET